MAIILRVDADSSYGKRNFINHFFSRMTSDFNLPTISKLPYLEDLKSLINLFNEKSCKGYFFFRKCTLPDSELLQSLNLGEHVIGLHLENSRSFETFQLELNSLENKVNKKIEAFSKHGSGKYKYGFNHYPFYEPEKYLEWAAKLGLKIFFGNLEDPSINNLITEDGLLFFPSAFWLEPSWRNTELFDVNWLVKESKKRDIVLLIHAENILLNKILYKELDFILQNSETKVI